MCKTRCSSGDSASDFVYREFDTFHRVTDGNEYTHRFQFVGSKDDGVVTVVLHTFVMYNPHNTVRFMIIDGPHGLYTKMELGPEGPN